MLKKYLMTDRLYTIICYDIEDDRQRNQIAQLLLDAGLTRVQKSVFEGAIDKKALRTLRQKLKRKIQDHDSIRYYNLCVECRSKTRVQGVNLTPEYSRRVIIN